MPNTRQPQATDLAEVWQDVVSKRHLLFSVALGVLLGLGAYIGGYSLLRVLRPDLPLPLTKGYSLFFGVSGCVLAAAIACVLFKPKRVITDAVMEDRQVLEALKEEGISPQEELAALKALPENVKHELEDVRVYERLVRILESSGNKSA